MLSILKSFKKETLILLLFFWGGNILILLSISKRELHLLINSFHHPFFDFFFKYVTYFGDGILFVIIIIYYFFKKNKESIKYMISAVLSLVLVSFFKRIVFYKSPRPIEYFSNESLHLVEGVSMAHWNSFPSGHTTTAFAIFVLLILNSQNKIVQLLFMTIAILAGISRIYLSQHFLVDVFVGSVLGVFIAIMSQYFFKFLYKNVTV